MELSNLKILKEEMKNYKPSKLTRFKWWVLRKQIAPNNVNKHIRDEILKLVK